jgi:hypothetical protein
MRAFEMVSSSKKKPAVGFVRDIDSQVPREAAIVLDARTDPLGDCHLSVQAHDTCILDHSVESFDLHVVLVCGANIPKLLALMG